MYKNGLVVMNFVYKIKYTKLTYAFQVNTHEIHPCYSRYNDNKYAFNY